MALVSTGPLASHHQPRLASLRSHGSLPAGSPNRSRNSGSSQAQGRRPDGNTSHFSTALRLAPLAARSIRHPSPTPAPPRAPLATKLWAGCIRASVLSATGVLEKEPAKGLGGFSGARIASGRQRPPSQGGASEQQSHPGPSQFSTATRRRQASLDSVHSKPGLGRK